MNFVANVGFCQKREQNDCDQIEGGRSASAERGPCSWRLPWCPTSVGCCRFFPTLLCPLLLHAGCGCISSHLISALSVLGRLEPCCWPKAAQGGSEQREGCQTIVCDTDPLAARLPVSFPCSPPRVFRRQHRLAWRYLQRRACWRIRCSHAVHSAPAASI